ncbi:ExbD/TolR family protein [Thermoproteota archaeon]
MRFEIAPLLDVIFILLIFFAVSTSLVVTQKGIKLQLPEASSGVKEKKGAVVSVDKSQKIYFDNKLIPRNALKSKIAFLIKEEPEYQVILNADKITPYNFIISVLDDIRLGGCYDIVLEVKSKITNEIK